jgi:hypothetical protein
LRKNKKKFFPEFTEISEENKPTQHWSQPGLWMAQDLLKLIE